MTQARVVASSLSGGDRHDRWASGVVVQDPSTPTQALAVVAVPVATALALLGGFVLDALGGDDRRSAHAN